MRTLYLIVLCVFIVSLAESRAEESDFREEVLKSYAEGFCGETFLECANLSGERCRTFIFQSAEKCSFTAFYKATVGQITSSSEIQREGREYGMCILNGLFSMAGISDKDIELCKNEFHGAIKRR